MTGVNWKQVYHFKNMCPIIIMLEQYEVLTLEQIMDV
jgi:hypothetical protein